MKLIPILTEKSMSDAQAGKYTFWIERGLNKHKIAEIVSEVFEVEVASVRTMNYPSITKRNYLGRKRQISARKKAVITLKTKNLPKGKKDKIDLFEAKK